MKGAWLGIDTVFCPGAAAVVRADQVSSIETVPEGVATSEGLLPAVQRALGEADAAGPDLEGIAFTRGPGSYTGLRIAVATVRGLSTGWSVPLMGVSSLRLLSWGAGLSTPVLAVIRARKGEVFGALYASSDPFSHEIIPPGVYLASRLAERARAHHPAAVGSGRLELGEARLEWLPRGHDKPGPEKCAILGRITSAEKGFDPSPEPLYLRDFMEKAGTPGA